MGIEVPLRRSGRPGELPPRHRRQDPLLLRRDAAQSRSSTVFPIAEVAKIGRELGVPLIMDNTAARCCASRSSMAPRSSCIRRRNISAATAPRSAASSSMAAISTGRSMPTASRCSTSPTRAITARSGRRRSSRSGPIAYILKARVTLLRDLGAAMSPFNAFLFIQGLETLAAAHARSIAPMRSRWRSISPKHPKVTKVIFPGLMTGEAKRRADAYLKGGYGGLVGFELKGGARRRPALHRRAEDVLPRRQYRRRALASPSIRPPRRIRSSRPRSRRRPASPTAMSGCRSASSTSTTSSPTSTRRWRRRKHRRLPRARPHRS